MILYIIVPVILARIAKVKIFSCKNAYFLKRMFNTLHVYIGYQDFKIAWIIGCMGFVHRPEF
jgi:uncharacterized membrane protein